MDLRQALQQRVLVADGAMGTLLYGNYGISSAFENLNLTHPDTILRVPHLKVASKKSTKTPLY